MNRQCGQGMDMQEWTRKKCHSSHQKPHSLASIIVIQWQHDHQRSRFAPTFSSVPNQLVAGSFGSEPNKLHIFSVHAAMTSVDLQAASSAPWEEQKNRALYSRRMFVISNTWSNQQSSLGWLRCNKILYDRRVKNVPWKTNHIHILCCALRCY